MGSLAMPNSSGIVTAMMDDASDGKMDGMMGRNPISMGGMGGMMARLFPHAQFVLDGRHGYREFPDLYLHDNNPRAGPGNQVISKHQTSLGPGAP
jgi:hypothetical protein